MMANLCLPNREVRGFFQRTVVSWLGSPTHVDRMKTSLLALHLDKFAEHLAESITTVLSYHDVGPRTEEKTYHILMVGLLASLSDLYEVLSNREPGHGRYDLALTPRKPGQPGFIFEFKKASAKNLAQKAQEGLDQILEKDYSGTMGQAGVTTIVAIGLAFHGKLLAIASSIQDLTKNQTNQVVHYLAGEEELKTRDPIASTQQEEAEAIKATCATQIQLLQQERGLPITPFEILS